MKKNFWTILCLVLALALPFGALAEEPDLQLEGFVTEIVEGGFVIEDAVQGKVMLNTSEATVWDGILQDAELEAGQYVIVDFDGRMTFSLPPQAHADRVGSHVLTGVVGEVTEEGFLLTDEPTFGEAFVRLPEAMPHLYQGMPVTVYYDGVMTMSLPGQVNARHIIVPEITGTVSELTEEGFLLTDEAGMEYSVLFGESTFISLQEAVVETEEDAAAEEETAEEGEEALDEEAVTKEETPEESADETEALAEEGEEADGVLSSDIEWGDGDTVTVYYNGMMTRSLPPQVTALEVAVIR